MRQASLSLIAYASPGSTAQDNSPAGYIRKSQCITNEMAAMACVSRMKIAGASRLTDLLGEQTTTVKIEYL